MPIIRRGTPFRRRILHRRGLRGLGDVCVPTDPDYDPSACESGGLPGMIPPASTPQYPNGTGPLPASSSTALMNSLPTILQQGFKTLQLAIAPQGSYLVQGPNGTYTISNQVPGALPGQLNLGSAGSFNMGSVLLFGGIAIVGLFALKEIGGK